MDAVQKDSTQMSVILVPSGENSPTQERGPQQDRAQVKGQDKRLTEEAYEPKAQERGQEYRIHELGHEH